MTKELLEGYVGVKYRPICISQEVPEVCAQLYEQFRAGGDLLRTHSMTPANGGNLSQRAGDGFVITTSGCNLSIIDGDELALVHACSLPDAHVSYSGAHRPSSEAMLHHLIYEEHLRAGAVVHAHDELATSSEAAGELPETAREAPYGTVELAQLAVQAFAGGSDIIVLKNHGYVAIGADLRQAIDIVIRMHLRLTSLREEAKA